jgi:hypothetical protein
MIEVMRYKSIQAGTAKKGLCLKIDQNMMNVASTKKIYLLSLPCQEMLLTLKFNILIFEIMISDIKIDMIIVSGITTVRSLIIGFDGLKSIRYPIQKIPLAGMGRPLK